MEKGGITQAITQLKQVATKKIIINNISGQLIP